MEGTIELLCHTQISASEEESRVAFEVFVRPWHDVSATEIDLRFDFVPAGGEALTHSINAGPLQVGKG